MAYWIYRRSNITSSLGASLALGLAITLPAHADLSDFQGQFANAVEESSAIANQATFNSLLLENGGPCDASQRAGSGACSGKVFSVFDETRELIQTANELLGDGPIEFSLGLDLDALGEALRWTAAEEYAGQGSLSTEFVDGQLSGLASRITALRFGATGFFIAGMPVNGGDETYARYRRNQVNGMGASADSELVTPWGGFLNGSFGYGDKEATGNEDAFDFEGFEFTGGVDYRYSNQWVFGGVVGYSSREIDFEQVENIVVDGGIEVEGYSIIPFALFQGENLFGSVSLGYQTVSFDTDRFIKYLSLNPDIESTNSRTASSTDSDTITLQASTGYSFDFNQFHVEPYVSVEYLAITIDAFDERDLNGDGFDLAIEEQDYDSLEATLGVKFVYTFLPSWGVISPFIDIELRNQFEDGSRIIEAAYRGAQDGGSPASFRVATDELDDQYFVIAAGVSAVFPHGFQAYLSFRTIEDLDFYSHQVIGGGIRYEF